jgi:DNA-binding FrmR family transcriptional regulator
MKRGKRTKPPEAEGPREGEGPAIGPGGQAAGIDPTLKAANLKQLRRIEGQVRGIARMIEEDRYCADVVTQVAAVRESLHSVAHNLLRSHLVHCAAHAFREGGDRSDSMVEELLHLTRRLAR